MEPSVMVCSPTLRRRWLELARNNGIEVSSNGEYVVIVHKGRSFNVRIDEQKNGRFRLNIQQIEDLPLRTRIELMTLISGGQCPVSLAPLHFVPTFRCPLGFCDEWITKIPAAQIRINYRWFNDDSIHAVDGDFRTPDFETGFVTGAFFEEETNDFREFISFSPKRPLVCGRRFEESFDRQMEIVRNLGGIEILI